ncbi:MAG: replicative DNA helicase [Muribaculaceae bacterium]|nr:replicative DNA helicase [Muribaculaceae bacterium]
MEGNSATTDRPRFQRKNNQLPAEIAGRLVPRAVEIEAAVLGALMLERDAFTAVCDLLRPESFYDPRHVKIYTAIQSLGMAQEPIDMLTVTNRLRHDGELESVGGAGYVAGLTMNVASAAHVETHAKIVAQKYLARELISFASKVENGAFDESNDIDDLLQEAEKQLFDISQRNLKKDVTQIDPVLDRAVEQMQMAGRRQSGLSGLGTGFRELDKMTSGWQNSDLIIIAARPAMGKTAFVLSMALNIALHDDPVAVFSLEMSDLQLVNRLISNACELPGEKIKSGDLSTSDWGQLTTRLSRLQGLPLYVDDTSGLSIMELRTKARRLVREHGVKIIIIDYLQLMTAGMKLGSREQEVSTISRSLKTLAKELNIPIIALSQLNRKLEDRGNKDKRPQLSDLRESGAIEQDADIVCFIHRPEYYSHTGLDEDGNNIRGKAEFILAKHRSGSIGTVDMLFRKEYVRFENWDAADANDNSGGFVMRASKDNADGAPDAAQAAADAAALGLPQSGMKPNDNFAAGPAVDVPF